MKKNILILLAGIFLFSSFSLNKTITFTGTIKSYGNVPFNYPVVETSDNKVLKIKDGKYTQEDVKKYENKKLEITGIVTKEKFKKTVEYFIEIEDIQIIK